MKKLSELSAPALAAVVKEKSIKGAIAEIKNSIYAGADMIDLHLPCLSERDEESLRRIISSSSLPVLALHYNQTYEGEDAGFSEEDRVELLVDAVRAGAHGIDMQGYTYDIASKSAFVGEDKYSFTKGNPKEVVTDAAVISKQCEFIERVHSMGSEVLLSCHPGIFMNCEQVVDLALFLEERRPDIIKIVTRADTEDELFETMRTMPVLKREVKTPISFHASGEAGKLSRIVNPALGGQIAFCIERYNEASVMEQLDLRTARAVIDGIRKML